MDEQSSVNEIWLSSAFPYAFPDLHLIDIDIREREFLLKVGKP